MGHRDCWPEPILFLPLPLRFCFEYCSTIVVFPSRKGLGKGKQALEDNL